MTLACPPLPDKFLQVEDVLTLEGVKNKINGLAFSRRRRRHRRCYGGCAVMSVLTPAELSGCLPPLL